MKISNFKLIKKIPADDRMRCQKFCFVATVDVSTGWFLFKKVEQKQVYLEHFNNKWKWMDNGEYTPNNDVERLASSFKSKKGKCYLSECI